MNSPKILTAICQASVKNAPNGLSPEQIADLLGCSYATLMSELSGQPGHKLGAERMLGIMKITASRAPMQYLARELGGVFIELPECPAGCHEITRSLLQSIREFGEFASEVGQSLEDGTITEPELSKISSEGHEALTAIMRVIQLAKAKLERTK